MPPLVTSTAVPCSSFPVADCCSRAESPETRVTGTAAGRHHLRRNRVQAHSGVANQLGLGDQALRQLPAYALALVFGTHVQALHLARVADREAAARRSPPPRHRQKQAANGRAEKHTCPAGWPALPQSSGSTTGKLKRSAILPEQFTRLRDVVRRLGDSNGDSCAIFHRHETPGRQSAEPVHHRLSLPSFLKSSRPGDQSAWERSSPSLTKQLPWTRGNLPDRNEDGATSS